MAFMFSFNGQFHPDAVKFVRFQIDYKLRLVDGKSTPAKINSIWKLCVRHVFAAINRTTRRNIQRKITRMVNASDVARRKATSSSSARAER